MRLDHLSGLQDPVAFLGSLDKLLKGQKGILEDSAFKNMLPAAMSVIVDNINRKDLLASISSVLLHLFRRLDISSIRKECLPLVSLGCWEGLSNGRMERELAGNERFKAAWPKVSGHPRNRVMISLLCGYRETGSVEIGRLLTYFLLQWPTRRFLAVLMDDFGVFIGEQVDPTLLQYLDYPLDQDSFSAMSEAELADEQLNRLEAFHLFVLQNASPDHDLASRPLTSLAAGSTSEAIDGSLAGKIREHYGFPLDGCCNCGCIRVTLCSVSLFFLTGRHFSVLRPPHSPPVPYSFCPRTIT